ncbi:MAG: PIN domain-containing protein [Methanobrevibacter sp.]|nr:PIN domain-containing protein [Methanobrevibacter sp.]
MIFLDTSYFIALFNEKDHFHKRAIEVNEMIRDEDKIISSLVITEVLTVLKQKKKVKNIAKIKEIYNNILDSCSLIEDFGYYEKATEEYFNNEIGFYDSMYIVLVRELELDGLVSFDKHFENRDGIIRIH